MAKYEGYSYSRELTDEEEQRMNELNSLYKNVGMFPEKELSKIISENDGTEDELYYVYENNYFHFPTRKLTDEELLELIDFVTVEEYVIEKNYEEEYKEEIEQEKQFYHKELENVRESGGISEDQAIKIATDKLVEVFGTTLSDYDQHSYLALADEAPFPRDTYCVNWGNDIAHKYYYFLIDAYTGEIYEISYSSGDILDSLAFTEESFTRLYEDIVNDSLAFLKEHMGIDGSYDRRVYYFTDTDKHRSNCAFVELTGNNEAYILMYTSEGIFCDYSHKEAEEYQEYIAEMAEYDENELFIIE